MNTSDLPVTPEQSALLFRLGYPPDQIHLLNWGKAKRLIQSLLAARAKPEEQ